jgi:UDP-GlcNAc:undecaprenyl-phosphate GlcNAc-1-phosphate transferase
MITSPLLISCLITLAAILVLRPVARKVGLMDAPGGRKSHTQDTPLIGGLGIYVGLLAGCWMLPEILGHYQWLLTISALLLFTGMVDDYFPLPALMRMGIQILAAWLMCTYGGNQLETLGRLVSPQELFLEEYSVLMTIFATVGVINAINMIDGMDGLSGGMVAVCLVMLSIAAATGNNPALTRMALLLLSCVVAFLLLNFRAPVKKSALIYLGDSGSTMLGFILAWLLIESSQGGNQHVISATVALWFIAIPLMDTVYLMIARPLTRKSPFAPGTDHLHHLIEAKGITRPWVVGILFGVGLLFGGVGLLINSMPAMERYSLYLFLILFGLYIVLMRKIILRH